MSGKQRANAIQGKTRALWGLECALNKAVMIQDLVQCLAQSRKPANGRYPFFLGP